MPTTSSCRRPQTGSSIVERKKPSLDGHLTTFDALFEWLEYPLLVYSSQHGVPTLPSVPAKAKQPAASGPPSPIIVPRPSAHADYYHKYFRCDDGAVSSRPARTPPDQAHETETQLPDVAVHCCSVPLRKKFQDHTISRKHRLKASRTGSSSDGGNCRPSQDCILAAVDDGLLDCAEHSNCASDSKSVMRTQSDADGSTTAESKDVVEALKAQVQQLERRNRYLEGELRQLSKERSLPGQEQQASCDECHNQQQLPCSEAAVLQQLQVCNPPAAEVHIAGYKNFTIEEEKEQQIAEESAMAVDHAFSVSCHQPHDACSAVTHSAAANNDAEVSAVDEALVVHISHLADDTASVVSPAVTVEKVGCLQQKEEQQEQQQSQQTVQQQLLRLQMLHELLQTDYADLEYVLKETERQRREYAARYAFVVMDNDKDGYISTEQVEGYELFTCYAPEVLRASFSYWHWRSGFPGYFNIDDFVKFVECAEDRSSRQSQRFWFSVLDCDGDGRISWQDMKQLYDAVDKAAASFVVSFEDLMNQIRDMVEEQQRPEQGFTCSEMWKSKLGAGVIALLTNHNNMLLQRSTAEWGRANFAL